jgi:hypothetical protein
MLFFGRKVWRVLAQRDVRLGDGAGAFVYIPHLSACTRCLATVALQHSFLNHRRHL